MLQISPAQYDALSADEIGKFRGRLVTWLIQNHRRAGNPPASDDLCRRAVDEAMDLCGRHGVKMETDIAAIALRILRWGPKLNAPEVAHVMPILRDDAIPGDEKISAIQLHDAMREAGDIV